MSIIAINNNGVVFQSLKDEKVLATLTVDSQNQIRVIFEAEDFSAIDIETVDYNYLKKYNNVIEQIAEAKDNKKEKVSKLLTKSGKLIVGQFIPSKVVKELLTVIYKEVDLKEKPTGTTIKEYYSVKEHTARVEGKLTKGF